MSKQKKKKNNSPAKPVNKGGRPKKYTDAELFSQKIEEYFEKCDKKEKPYTFAGLALALDMSVRSLRNYSKDEAFFPSVNRARLRILDQYEGELFRAQGSTSGVMFALKNNFEEYKDESTVNQNVNGTLSIEEFLKDKPVKL